MSSIEHLSRSERENLYRLWRDTLLQSYAKRCVALKTRLGQLTMQIKNLNNELKLGVLKKASIIGMTTSGFSKLSGVLQAVGIKVVLVEEASEILEAHLLACLGPSVRQVVLIGDHYQLRPKCTEYALSVESGLGYNLNLSLFERLVRKGAVHLHTLTTQWRMRPCISELIRSTIYPNLRDHLSVSRYPDVRGMAHNVFFLMHAKYENGKQNEPRRAAQAEENSNNTHSNSHEVNFVVALTSYLLDQGYHSSDITVLTPYVGQLRVLRQAFSSSLSVAACLDERDEAELDNSPGDIADNSIRIVDGSDYERKTVRLATIDNFQGEESKIVVISLVRSNASGKIGFLKQANRINVLLSRAKHGMFLVGNPACLCASPRSRMWRLVLELLERQQAVGPAFVVRCPHHPNAERRIEHPDEFLTKRCLSCAD